MLNISLYSLSFYAVCAIATGAVIMVASIFWASKIRKIVHGNKEKKWKFLSLLMVFFLAGYIFFTVVIVWPLGINRDILTGIVFLGGAVFVFLVMDVSYQTIQDLKQMDELKKLNNLLEEKQKELAQANQLQKKTIQDVINFTEVANEISQGKLDINLPSIEGCEQLKELSNSFERMVESLKIAMEAME